MSGSGKRGHEEFSGNLPNSGIVPSSKQQQDEDHRIPTGNGDMASADAAPPPADNAVEPRPPKLPRLDYGSRFQKRAGAEDPSAATSFGLDGKGDARDIRSKSGIDEKGGIGDTKMSNYEEKGDSDTWRDMRLDSAHEGRATSALERFNRNGGGVSGSGSWRRDQRPEHKEDLREQWKEVADGKWDTKMDPHEERGEKDAARDVTNERNIRSSWRRDQRFENKEDGRELWKDYKDRASARLGTDHRDASFWSKRIGRKNSMEEDGELKESEEAALEMQGDFKREEKEREQERKARDDILKEKEDKERDEKSARGWGGHASIVIETGRDRWEKSKETKEKGRDRREPNHVEKEELGVVKLEMEETDLPKNTGSEAGNVAEHTELERKSSKDFESIKGVDIDDRDRRKERDRDKKLEHDKVGDRKSRESEKAVDDVSPEDGERDKEIFVNHNFQQKRRMLRSRGPSQALNRDGRPRMLSKDLDGNSGGAETAAIIYKPGEYMPELTKLWKEYESSKNGESTSSGQGPTMEIRIPSKLVTTSNHQVRGSQLWGTDVYTDDSDLVAVLMHTGYYRPTASQPPFSVQELRATVRVLPPQDSYTSTLRNNIRSRAWGAASGCSFSVEQCRIMKVSGGHIDLEPCLTRISAVAPTLAPAAMERTMTTRAAASNAYRQQRFVQEVTIQYNLCNEPWMKYSMSIVADRGLKKSQFTSARLRKGEVLYLETHKKRYELSYDGEKVACNGGYGATSATSAPVAATGDKNRDKENDKTVSNHNGERLPARGNGNNEKGHQNGDTFDHYKWAICKQPLPLKVMLAKGVPLLNDFVEVLEDGLAWEEIQWSQTGVWVRDKEYPLARAQFLSQNADNLV